MASKQRCAHAGCIQRAKARIQKDTPSNLLGKTHDCCRACCPTVARRLMKEMRK